MYDKKETEIGPSSLVNKEGNEGMGNMLTFYSNPVENKLSIREHLAACHFINKSR